MTEDHAKPTLALIAHDGKKADMIAFVMDHKQRLAEFDLLATATTGALIEEKTGLTVKQMLSGPLGGDAQIAAKVATGQVQLICFFLDPLGKHPHDPISKVSCAFAMYITCLWRLTLRQPFC